MCGVCVCVCVRVWCAVGVHTPCVCVVCRGRAHAVCVCAVCHALHAVCMPRAPACNTHNTHVLHTRTRTHTHTHTRLAMIAHTFFLWYLMKAATFVLFAGVALNSGTFAASWLGHEFAIG